MATRPTILAALLRQRLALARPRQGTGTRELSGGHDDGQRLPRRQGQRPLLTRLLAPQVQRHPCFGVVAVGRVVCDDMDLFVRARNNLHQFLDSALLSEEEPLDGLREHPTSAGRKDLCVRGPVEPERNREASCRRSRHASAQLHDFVRRREAPTHALAPNVLKNALAIYLFENVSSHESRGFSGTALRHLLHHYGHAFRRRG
mmetsp:Transcript_8561/g.22099  ORF Transcript_8561/g.22099 Transcript_8561/m.22099 type:complete len:203 (+) Transcript_8561:144-752(+)